MSVLVTGCSRYATWINIGQAADGTPRRDDLAREVDAERLLLRIEHVRTA